MRADSVRPTRPVLSGLLHAYRLRWKRRRLLYRIWRKRRQLTTHIDHTARIKPNMVLAFCCVRNEIERLPFFMTHNRRLGVGHFLFVDNGSDDGTLEFLAKQPDVSIWATNDSYRLSRFGMDWLGWLQLRFGQGHWCLTVDADELLIYPNHETHELGKLTAWLESQNRASFGAVMIDLYPKGPVGDDPYQPGDDPTLGLGYFDGQKHRTTWHPVFDNLWIQGGVRDRVFFKDQPTRAPTLNKTPLVKWNKRYAYVSSTHQILPRQLHDVFGDNDRAIMTGALLHTKFLPSIVTKSKEELARRQHFQNTALYKDYHQALAENPTLWDPASYRYDGWKRLVDIALISKEDWV